MKRALPGQISDLDLRLMRVFRAVVECGGFAAAELQLNIGRSTISRHIKDLETRLGLTLCRRGRGGFALTPEGTRVYESSARVLGAIADLRNEVQQLHENLSGNLHLALFDKTATNPACRIQAAIGRLAAMAPETGLEISVQPMNEIERGVLDGRFHIGVIPVQRRSAACAYFPLFGERMFLYCGDGHPFFGKRPRAPTEREIRASAFAGLGFHSVNMERAQAFGLTRRATAFDQEGVATLILSGAYLGFLPDHYAAGFVHEGRMRPVRPERFSYTCSFEAIVRADAHRSRLAQTFLDLLVEAHAG